MHGQIDDEFTFITELSYLLSTRYQRPISSVVVTLQHGACMVFGGTFDPAYVLSVHALSTQLQPTTNKRNAALIQKHLEEVLAVRPSRGFLRFIPTPEENTARNGKTIAGEIEEGGRMTAGQAAEEFTGLRRTRSKPKSRLSVRVSVLPTSRYMQHGANVASRSGLSDRHQRLWRRRRKPRLLPAPETLQQIYHHLH
jgi:hypothetical protein